MDTTLLNRITTNPSILTGKPVIRGMRISVEQILKMLARGIGQSDIIIEYPMLEEYDFSGGERGRYTARYAQGANLVAFSPDVAEFTSTEN